MRRRTEGEERERRQADEAEAVSAHEQRILAMGIRPEAGNQAIGRMIARVKDKKVGARNVRYAESRKEAEALCREEAEANGVEWDDLGEMGQETVIGPAMKDAYVGGEPGPINISLAATFPRDGVRDAVQAWRNQNGWARNRLKVVSNLHGFPVRPTSATRSPPAATRAT